MDKNLVLSAARGQWERIYSALAPQLTEAMSAAETHRPHVDCPVPGHYMRKGGSGAHGIAKFRLQKDNRRNWKEDGSAICTCGCWNGISLLRALNGWGYGETINRVGECLGLSENKTVEVISLDDSEARSATGKVVLATTCVTSQPGRQAYSYFKVRLRKADGAVETFRGSMLEQAMKVAEVKEGDNAQIDLLGVQQCRSSKGAFTRYAYAVKKLPSDEQLAAKAAQDAKETAEARKRISALWQSGSALEANAPASDSVRRYLASRKIGALDSAYTKDLRSVSNLSYFDNDGDVTKWDGMIAAVRDVSGRLVSLHRTYLSDGKKAPVDRPKMLMRLGPKDSISGCAIHLGEPERGVLCVAEGIETAASVVIGTGFPCWSCVSANGLKGVRVPAEVKLVLIFEDKDASGTGQKAAEALRERLAAEGRIAVVCAIEEPLPEGCHGLDWNDMLRKGRPFPVRKPVKN